MRHIIFNSSIKYLFCIAILACSSLQVFAAAPANDSLASAETISGVSGSINRTNVEATRESGEFSHAGGNSTVFRTVWFKWTAPNTMPVTFEVTNSNGGFDTAMAAYTGAGFPLLTISRNNDTLGNKPRIEFRATAGVVYNIAVGTFNTEGASGSFDLAWSQSATPSNDLFANASAISGDAGDVAITTSGANSEAGEQAVGNGNTVWLKYTNASARDISVTFTTRYFSEQGANSAMCVKTGLSVNSLSRVVCNTNLPAMNASAVIFLAKAGVSYYIEIDNQDSFSQPGNHVVDWRISRPRHSTDIVRKDPVSKVAIYDEAADAVVFRPSNGTWYRIDSSSNSYHVDQFGLDGDTPVAADYDGDGSSDLAVTRLENGFTNWYIRSSFDNSLNIQQWGLSGDKAVPADYDFDGRMDIAVFRPSSGTWYYIESSTGLAKSVQWGLPGDIPVRGDFKSTRPGADFAVFRPSNGSWYITDLESIQIKQFGLDGDIPTPGNFDGNEGTDFGVYRPSNGTWYQLRSNTIYSQAWGIAGDIPQPGDFDANSNDYDDHAVYRPSNNTWYLMTAETTRIRIFTFGMPGDIPATSITY